MNKKVKVGMKNGKAGISRLLSAFFVIAAMLFSVVAISPGSVRAAANSTLYFSQSDLNTQVTTASVTNGSSITLNPTINTGTNNVSIVSLKITFDATKLSLDTPVLDAGTGNPATPADPTAPFINAETSIVNAVNNTNGTASFDISVGSANPSANGVLKVASLTFHAIATGSAAISFTGVAGTSGAAADGETGNVVTSSTGTTVTVAANGSDVTPPVLSAGSPSGSLAAGTTQTNITLQTNETATCKYSNTAGVAYAAMTTTATAQSTNHSFAVSGLTDGSTYYYYVRCRDVSANTNANTSDYVISFSVAAPAPVDQPVSVPALKLKINGKSKSFSAKIKTKNLEIYSTVPDLANGKVRIENGTKLLKQVTIGANGKWNAKIKTDKFHIHYFNQAGQEVAVSKIYKLNVDTEDPKFTDLPLALSKKRGDKLWWKAKDNKGIKYFTYTIDGKTKKTTKSYFMVPTSLSWGLHLIKISIYDNAGNNTSRTVAVMIH